MAEHEIARIKLKGPLNTVLRATCSCGHFKCDVPRLSQPMRRKQDRLIAEHLAAVGAISQQAAE